MSTTHHEGTSPPEDKAIMKSTAIACAIAAASLGFGSLSYAQGWDRDGRDDRRGYAGREHRADHREARQAWREDQVQRRLEERQQYVQRHRDDYRHQQPYYGRQGGEYAHPGQWTSRVPQYRRGDYLPYQLRQRQYYVNDWRTHRLYAPPQGYQWVQADNSGDFLLVAIATGLIANLLLSQ
jgi:Ni/Co efflux regulator RcnB